jgi:hypothetical protein
MRDGRQRPPDAALIVLQNCWLIGSDGRETKAIVHGRFGGGGLSDLRGVRFLGPRGDRRHVAGRDSDVGRVSADGDVAGGEPFFVSVSSAVAGR